MKLNNNRNYTDIYNLMFSHNAEDKTKYFYNNDELNQLKTIKDQDIIDVILKNNVTAK